MWQTVPEAIAHSPTFWALGLLVTGFVCGFSAFQAILAVGAHEVIRKGTYVLKSEVIGKLLRTETIREIETLIDLGNSLDISKLSDAEVYMNRVHTFVHYLEIPKEYEIAGHHYSFAEQEIDRIIRDIPNKGGVKAPLGEKIPRIVGVLRGLRSSFLSVAGN